MPTSIELFGDSGLEIRQFTPPARFVRPRTKKADWIARKKVRREAEKKQLDGIESQDIFKATVEAKLIRAGAREVCAEHGWTWFDNFLRCGVEKFYIMCPVCESGHDAYYQCSQKWCPRCNWRISMRRRRLLEEMTKGIYGVKHVVLTRRNVAHMTREEIQFDRKNLLAIRRQGILGKVTGGCASLEFTNEENGWHPHWHLLLQSGWIDAHQLAIAYGKLVGQQFAIVKVLDVTETSYVQELCKYVVEGSELARWKPDQILEFIIALRGTRCFTVFGKFRDMARFARASVELDKVPSLCETCGVEDKVFGHDRQHAKRVAKKIGY